MSISAILLTLTLTITFLIVLDAVWLYIQRDYHSIFFAAVQKSPLIVRWIPAVIVYILIAFALLNVAIIPAKSPFQAAIRGAAVGATMYGFYDATNLATLSKWTWQMAITDTAWGALCCGITAFGTNFILAKYRIL